MINTARKNRAVASDDLAMLLTPPAVSERHSKGLGMDRMRLVNISHFRPTLDDHDFDFLAEKPAPKRRGWIKRAKVLANKDFDRVLAWCDMTVLPVYRHARCGGGCDSDQPINSN